MARLWIEDDTRGEWAVWDDAPADAARRVLIVLAGAHFSPARLQAEASCATAVVAADAGALVCLDAGIVPAAIVGDFDSLPGDARSKFDAATLHHDADPQTNDLEKAFAHAERAWRGAELVIAAFGGVDGGRMDHTLANLGPLVAEPHRRISMLDGDGRLVALRHGTLHAHGLAGRTLSILPWTLHGVTVSEQGVLFPLTHALLRLGGQGVSNEISSATAEVKIEDGVALVWVAV